MPPSKCDQKKAEIIRLAEEECSKESERAKATYELKCLKVEEKYEAKKEQACRDLRQQELEELDVIKRNYKAEMEPIIVKHAKKLSEIREKFRTATPEASLPASTTSKTPSSPTLLTVPQRLADLQKAEAGNDNSPASSRTFEDSQESGDETDTSIPAIAPQPTNNAEFPPRSKKRKRPRHIFDSDDEEPDFSQNENKDGQDDTSDVSSPASQESPSAKALKALSRPFTQRSGLNNASSASTTKTKNHLRQKEGDNVFETQIRATSSSRKTDSQAEEGDEDENIGSGSASQAPRRNRVRPGRPEPGKYRMNAKAWPA